MLSKKNFGQQKNQSNNSSFWIQTGISATNLSGIDKKISSLTLHGIGLTATAALEYNKEEAAHKLSFFYTGGSMKIGKDETNSLTYKHLGFEYTNLYNRKFSQKSPFQWGAGAATGYFYSKRTFDLINNNKSFESVASLGIQLGIVYAPKKIAGTRIINRIILPVVSAIKQPIFGSSQTSEALAGEGNSTAGFLNGWNAALIPAYFNLKNKVNIEKKMANGSNISIVYTWEYFHIKTNREVIHAFHQIGLLYSFTL
ncbi:MAG: hypothetical protein ACKVOW_04110 [Chitinophagaceae bacterium]